MAICLLHRGHRVICDDIGAVEVSEVSGRSERLWPSPRNLKLWRASLGAIAKTRDKPKPVLADMDKYRVPFALPADDRAIDLAAVVRLDRGDEPRIAALPGAEAVGALIANTFRGQLVASMERQAAYWHQCLDVYGAAGVHRLSRPRALDRLDEASVLIERPAADHHDD